MDRLYNVPAKISDRFPSDHNSNEFQLPSGNILWVKKRNSDDWYQYFVRTGEAQGGEIIIEKRAFPDEKAVDDDWMISYVLRIA